MKYTYQQMFEISFKYSLITNSYHSMAKIYYEGNELSYIDLIALFHISRNKGITVTQLSEINFRTKATISPVTNKLSDWGLLCKKQSLEDKRSYLFYLTDKGEEVLELHKEYILDNFKKIVQAITEEFDEDAVQQFFQVTGYITDYVKENFIDTDGVDLTNLKD